jgi:hypothetical protein
MVVFFDDHEIKNIDKIMACPARKERGVETGFSPTILISCKW